MNERKPYYTIIHGDTNMVVKNKTVVVPDAGNLADKLAYLLNQDHEKQVEEARLQREQRILERRAQETANHGNV